MTDRELLELAAKAAGIEHGADRLDCGLSITLPSGRHYSLPQWNPLEDDGDALRLAVGLAIAVFPPERYGDDATANGPHPDSSDWISETVVGDPYAATRRAIVRAAAALVAK